MVSLLSNLKIDIHNKFVFMLIQLYNRFMKFLRRHKPTTNTIASQVEI